MSCQPHKKREGGSLNPPPPPPPPIHTTKLLYDYLEDAFHEVGCLTDEAGRYLKPEEERVLGRARAGTREVHVPIGRQAWHNKG